MVTVCVVAVYNSVLPQTDAVLQPGAPLNSISLRSVGKPYRAMCHYLKTMASYTIDP